MFKNIVSKKYWVLLALLSIINPLTAGLSSDFTFKVNTELTTFGGPTFTIPTYGTGYKYNVDCDNDGTFEATGQTASYVCDYSNLGRGVFTILIRDAIGDDTGFPRFRFDEFGEANEVVELVNWGYGVWDSMDSALENTVNMVVTALDAPNLSDVESMKNMFRFASLADPDTSNWDVSHVEDMSYMFNFTNNAAPDTSNWDTSNVTDMSYMFDGANAAKPDTSGWDTAEVTNMRNMFRSAELANPDTSNWNTEKVTNMRLMFADAVTAIPDTSGWNTANVTTMQQMFSSANSANPDTSSWDIANVTTMQSMFNNTTLPTASYDDILVNFSSQTVQSGVQFSAGNAKYCATAARDNLIIRNGWVITDGGLDTTCPLVDPTDDFLIQVNTSISGASNATQFEIPTTGTGYNYNVDCDDSNPNVNTASAQTGNYTCNYASSGVYTIRIRDNAGDGTGFQRIFFNNSGDKDKIIDLVQWGTGQWSSMNRAFSGARNMTVTATDVPDLSQLFSLSSMFNGASMVNPDTSNWDISNVNDTSYMFFFTGMANPDTSNWNTSNVINMSYMFKSANSANPDTSNWNTSNVRNMGSMFSFADMADPDTSNWVTNNVTNMSYMFQNAFLANPDTSSWDITAVTTMQNMFLGVTLPTASYDAILNNFSSQTVQSGVQFHGGNSKYCAQISRNDLVNNNGWVINDGGIDPICDIIFRNSFELPVEKFNANEKQFSFDFELLEHVKLDSYPELIAIGLDSEQVAVIKFHVRKSGQIYQIRISDLDQDAFDEGVWIDHEWQNIDSLDLTKLTW